MGRRQLGRVVKEPEVDHVESDGLADRVEGYAGGVERVQDRRPSHVPLAVAIVASDENAKLAEPIDEQWVEAGPCGQLRPGEAHRHATGRRRPVSTS